MTRSEKKALIIGVDGGGSSTRARIAELVGTDYRELGEGLAGPSNVRSVGFESAMSEIETAIERAFQFAQVPRRIVGGACFGLAGADRPEEQQVFERWVRENQIARQLHLANDAALILQCACGDGAGMALIAGTGTLCVARDDNGETVRCGGWGYLLGDEGGAFWIAMQALQVFAMLVDDGQVDSPFVQECMKAVDISDPAELIPWLYREPFDRKTVATLAPWVFHTAASGEHFSSQIIDAAMTSLCCLVQTGARRAGLIGQFELGIAGGVLLEQVEFREQLIARVQQEGMPGLQPCIVDAPVEGALQIAALIAAHG